MCSMCVVQTDTILVFSSGFYKFFLYLPNTLLSNTNKNILLPHKYAHMKKTICYLSIFALSFTACKKSSDSNNTCTVSEAAIVGSYKITSVKYKANAATAEVEIFTNPVYFDVCDRDDIYIFNANHTAVTQDAGVVCTPSNAYSTTWSYAGSIFTYDGDVYSVDSFTCTSYSVSSSAYFTAGDKITIYFVRI